MDNIQIVLASKSPRRQGLIKELGFPVEIRIKEVEEVYPTDLPLAEVPEFLAKLKAEPLKETIKGDELLVTSDTVVLFDNQILGKPKDRDSAINMLSRLSDNTHTVITGVSLYTKNKHVSFSTATKVYFSELTSQEIETYIDEHQPFDKAGSYGIQEWIGYIGVKKIEGCYYNVMGLPLHDLYAKLKAEFI